MILLNKVDLTDEKTVGILKAAIQKLNPKAKIITSSFGKIPANEILNTKLFDFEEAQSSAGWQEELNGNHTPETEEYGISSFCFKSHKPFHPERFWNYLNEKFPETIIRSKGLFWLASRPDDAISFSQAGGSSRIERAGVWWISMPFSDRIQYPSFLDNQKYIEEKWDTTWGDRLTELVFIGQDIDKEKIVSDLEKCLLTENEIVNFTNKIEFADPFPTEI